MSDYQSAVQNLKSDPAGILQNSSTTEKELSDLGR